MSLSNKLTGFSGSDLSAFRKLEEFAYCWYLKETLDIKNKTENGRNLILILNVPYSQKELRDNIEEAKENDGLPEIHQNIVKWLNDDTIILEKETLEQIYHTFKGDYKEKGGELLSFTTLFNEPLLVIRILLEHGLNYLEKIKSINRKEDKQKRYAFSRSHLIIYSVELSKQANEKGELSEEDILQIARYLFTIIGGLLIGKNTHAKQKILIQTSEEVKKLSEVGSNVATQAEFKRLRQNIENYVNTNPVPLTQGLIAKLLFSIIPKTLIIVCSILVIGILVYFELIENRNSTIVNSGEPFFGITKVYDPNSPLAKGMHNMDSANYWLQLAIKTSNNNLKVVYCNRAINWKYDLIDAYLHRGIAKSQMGYRRDAIIDFTSCIIINPQNYYPYYGRGLQRLQLNLPYSALRDFNKALALDVNSSWIIFMVRGRTYAGLAKYNEAINDIEQVIKLNPSFMDSYFLMGQVTMELGHFYRAINFFTKYINESDFSNPPYKSIGNKTYITGEHIIGYDIALPINPNPVLAFYYRGNAYYNLNLFKEAILDYNCAIEYEPDNSLYYKQRTKALNKLFENAEMEFSKKNYEKAIDKCNEFLKSQPDSLLLAEAFMLRGDCYSEWANDLRKTIPTIDSNNIEEYVSLADSITSLNKRATANYKLSRQIWSSRN